jgi:hypothetical protein
MIGHIIHMVVYMAWPDTLKNANRCSCLQTNKQTNKQTKDSKLNESTYRWHHSVELSFDQGKKRVGLSAATAEVVDGIRDAPVALHGGGGAAVHVCVCVCVCV